MLDIKSSWEDSLNHGNELNKNSKQKENMKNSNEKTAKQKMIEIVETWINENEFDMKVSTQGNVMSARESLETIKTWNLAQAHKAMKKIISVGIENVSPLDYVAFI